MLELFNTNINHSSMTAKAKAQKALSERTYYAGDAELKFFDAKILACSISECGRYCFIVESLPLYDYGMKRGKVFNITGLALVESEPASMGTRNGVILSTMAEEVQKEAPAYWQTIKEAIKREYDFDMRFIEELEG